MRMLYTFLFYHILVVPCKRIKPIIEKLSEGLDSSKIEFYMIDINENEKLANTYNIKSVPTFLFIHKNILKDQCSGSDIQ